VPSAQPAARNLDGKAADGTSPLALEALTSGAIIDNGTIQLGVNPEAELNVPGGAPSSTGETTVGLRYLPNNTEAISPGCECEGWGIADLATGTSGYANITEGGAFGMSLVSFDTVGSTAVSTVDVGSTLRVTHDYHAAQHTNNLFEVTVEVTNISAAPVDLRYRRVMDWDVEPTPFDEFVTAVTGRAGTLAGNNNDGFATADPLGPAESGSIADLRTGDFSDVGPTDHGALFDFEFGALAPGESKLFFIYYGAAPTEADALAALASEGIGTYSLGQSDTTDGPTLGTPTTFIFGFGGLVELEPIPAGTEHNGSPNGGSSQDPVHTFTGSFTEQHQDVAIPGRGPAIAFTRTYNSNDPRVGPLGPGWTHSYATRLVDAGDGSGDLYLVGPQGRSDRYALESDGSYTAPASILTSLVAESDGSYTARHKDQSTWRFDAGGRLTAVVDRHGNTSSLTYDGSGNLTAIADPAGPAR
jgi:YD repeat-containing protein